MGKPEWYQYSIEEVFSYLQTGPSGLTSEETKARLDKYGANKLKEPKKVSLLELFFEQFKSFLILILIVATIISMAIGEFVEGIVIFAIVMMAAILGFIQNFRAEKAIQALKKMMQSYAAVIRDGKESEVLAESLVPGDIVLVEAGDRIPADCRILESMSLKVDEAVLTGESVPVEKTTDVLSVEIPLPERLNMLHTGTACVYGRGKAIVVDTGMRTEFGKIAASLEEIREEKTPLQVCIDNLGKWLGILTLSMCLLVGLLGILRGYPVLKMLIWAISLAVAAIPEALPAVITICLALGTRRMVKRNALVRRLSSVETLGSVNVICSDKTGTLTKGQMSVRRVFLNNTEIDVTGVGYEPKGEFIFREEKPLDSDLDLLLRIGCLCNDSQLKNEEGNYKILGDPTEAALVVVAYKKGLSKETLEKEYPRLDEIPFSSERKMMTTIHRNQDQLFAFSKGAGEIILEKCRLDLNQKQFLLDKQHKMAEEGLRVLAFAWRQIPLDLPKDKIEQELEFVGFMGMMDSPREEAKEAVRICKLAGIKPLMITGDHPLTAKKVAKETGILDKGLVLTGEELDRLSDEDLDLKIKEIEVIARVSPLHKLRIVEAYQKREDIVAMTGDGVNDAPALKKADIGVAMGITGTEVSKEVSDLILLDDNFATIVNAVEEGRVIFANIRRFLVYLLTDNIGAIMAIILLFFFWGEKGLPLTPAQILFINLLMDGVKAIALSIEPAQSWIMKLSPHNPKRGVLTRHSYFYIFFVGLWICIVSMAVYLWALRTKEHLTAVTLLFVTIILLRTFNAFNCRSERQSVFELGIFTNRWLIYAFIATVVLTLPVLYVPFLQKAFSTTSLGLMEWLIAFLASSTVFILVEIAKFLQGVRGKQNV